MPACLGAGWVQLGLEVVWLVPIGLKYPKCNMFIFHCANKSLFPPYCFYFLEKKKGGRKQCSISVIAPTL